MHCKNHYPATVMPTVFTIFGYRFMFYSNDHEPIHVHIVKDGKEAKYNIKPLEQVFNNGYKNHEIAIIESLIMENEDTIKERWIEYFKKQNLHNVKASNKTSLG